MKKVFEYKFDLQSGNENQFSALAGFIRKTSELEGFFELTLKNLEELVVEAGSISHMLEGGKSRIPIQLDKEIAKILFKGKFGVRYMVRKVNEDSRKVEVVLTLKKKSKKKKEK